MSAAPFCPGGVGDLGARLLAGTRRIGTRTLLTAILVASATHAYAGPFIWDEDTNRIDDRIESVNLLGYRFAFENADSLQRQRIVVTESSGQVLYSIYVVYDHTPTSADLSALALAGLPARHRFESVPAIRSVGTFGQIKAVSALPGIERIEAVPALYPLVREGAAAIGMRDASESVFPTWASTDAADGSGTVIAFLDTGINDAPDGVYPGHESLIGRCLGGAQFVNADSSLDTPMEGSENPVDHGADLTEYHGTHVASIALGSGGESGYARGVAPGASFLDVKVIDDFGIGTGVAEGLDWCVHNRARDWGGPSNTQGIDVINLSVSSLDRTDGNDVVSRVANRAVELGIVVIASIGNDGFSSYVPSPAGGDLVLAVGAFDDQRSPLGEDDRPATFNNTGPRASDGDADPYDEQKPDLLAPGVAILGADGDRLSDGTRYKRLTGTSMAAPFVSGAVAVLRSAHPELNPGQIAELLRATASRQLVGVPAGQNGVDPRWYSSIGFGALDLYAAKLELDQPGRSQIARLELTSSEDEIHAVLRTQRELGAEHFVFERAPDVSGAPGTFAAVDSVAAVGDPSLVDAVNRVAYPRTWSVPEAERGQAFWYRVSYTEGAVRYDSPARRFTSPLGPSAATVMVTIVHNAYDSDVDGVITAGSNSNHANGPDGYDPAVSFPLPGSSAAVASDWVNGASATGNVAWTFRVEIPRGAADAWLPPDAGHVWVLNATEGGYVNRSGRISDFRVIWRPTAQDSQVFVGGPTPQPTVEGLTTVVAAPSGVLGVEPLAGSRSIIIGPNPVRSGGEVSFASSVAITSDLRIFDLAGREIARLPWTRSGLGARAAWGARDQAGRMVPSGVYFARMNRGAIARLVVLAR
jgi:subtilisin family serine protease